MKCDYATALPGSASLARSMGLDDQTNLTANFYTRAISCRRVASPPTVPRKGTWFDEAIDFRDPEGDALTQEILKLVATVENRKRKIRHVDELNRYTLVRKMIANGFRCHFYRQPRLVTYFRRAGSYRNCPSWLSGKAMARTMNLLVKARLIDNYLGEWGERASSFHIKPKLYGMAQACGITDNSLNFRLPRESLIRLREGNAKTGLVDYEPTDETRRWTALLEAYNAFIDQQDIVLTLTAEEEAEWVKHLNLKRHKDSPSFSKAERFKTDLYRQFNNGSFHEGGRMYGGWWINAPKALRPRITINGKQTVELDFSGCAVRMLYHERGLECSDDPYHLELIAEYEQEIGKPGHFRQGIKALTQALLNNQTKAQPWRIPVPDRISFRPQFNRKQIWQMIQEKHAPIAGSFGTGPGLRLQRRDSDLALTIITELMKKNIVALPVHDSFLTNYDNANVLKEEMNRAYKDMFNFSPIVKSSVS